MVGRSAAPMVAARALRWAARRDCLSAETKGAPMAVQKAAMRAVRSASRMVAARDEKRVARRAVSWAGHWAV